jgi:hypothetical protein
MELLLLRIELWFKQIYLLYLGLKLRWYMHRITSMAPAELKRSLWEMGFRPHIEGEVWTYRLPYDLIIRIREIEKEER